MSIIKTIKDEDLARGRELLFLEYLDKYGPCSIPALIQKIKKNHPEVENPEHLNKLTKSLKVKGLAKVSSQKCQLLSTKPRAEVIEICNQLPKSKRKKSSKHVETILKSSIDSVCLAIESFNKPKSAFKTENFIILIINAWVKLCHAYLLHYEGNYRESKIDPRLNKKKTFSLRDCLNKIYTRGDLSLTEKMNLEFCIKLRDLVEHSYVDGEYIDIHHWGRYQAVLNSYNDFFKEHFGENLLKGIRLSFALQISFKSLSQEHIQSIKKTLSSDENEILSSLEEYSFDKLSNGSEDIDASKFSVNIKVATEFVKNPKKADYILKAYKDTSNDYNTEKTLQLVQNIARPSGWRPGECCKRINNKLPQEKYLKVHHLVLINKLFKIRPYGNQATLNPHQVIKDYCFYDVDIDEYRFTQNYIDFVVGIFRDEQLKRDELHKIHNKGKVLLCKDYILV